MKTTLLLLSLAVLTVGTKTLAQSRPHPIDIMQTLRPVNKAIPVKNAHNAAKTTLTQGSRLIAEAAEENNGTSFYPYDSVYLVYSGLRGGDLAHTLDYDTAYVVQYDLNSAAYDKYAFESQTFDANNNVLSDLEATWNATTSSYANVEEDSFTYDANNNMLMDKDLMWNAATSSWNNGSEYIYTYNSNNKMLTEIYAYGNGNTWINSTKDTFTYDGNGNMLADLNLEWNGTNNTWGNNTLATYTYNAGNNMLTEQDQTWDGASAWINDDLYAYTYDANNNMLTDLYQVDNGTGNVWLNSYTDTFAYDGANDPLTDKGLTWDTVTNAFVKSYLITNTGFVSQQPLTSVYQTWDTTNSVWNNMEEELSAYNSYNQQTVLTLLDWNGSAWVGNTDDEQDFFYYQTYNLSVKPVTNAGGSALIYPVPTQDQLHISLTWDAPQACNIAIYDVQGRILKQWQVPSATSYQNTISVRNLAAGNYFLNITGANGQIVQKLIVSR